MTKSDELRNMGLKATIPRVKILDLFQKAKGAGRHHMSAEEVQQQLAADEVDLGLATVYRVLTQFEQAGLLTRHFFDSGRAVFEINEGGHHDHLVCLQCGRVEEFYDAAIEKRQTKVAEDRGFKVIEHSLHMYADCTKPNCPNRKES